MSNCTIAMDEEYTFQTATLVLELHFFAMFSPGFYTGKFIKHRCAVSYNLALIIRCNALSYVGSDLI